MSAVKTQLSRLIFVALFFMALVPATTVVPYVMGYLFPVVGNIHLTTIEVREGDRDHVRLYAAMDKFRDCDFIDIEWFLGRRGQDRVRVQTEWKEQSRIKLPGKLTFGPLRAQMHWTDVTHNSHADVIHKCKIGQFRLPWTVRTKLYN